MYVLIKYQGKTKRKVMNLLEEVAVLGKLDRRIRTAAIICHYNVNNVTIHFINPH